MNSPAIPNRAGRSAFRRGLADGFGAPAAVLFAGMVGFGALGKSVGLSLWTTTGATIFVYALPGQVVFAEMAALQASGWAIGLAAALTAARFLPMTLTVMPQIPAEQRSPRLFLIVHLLSMTSWAIAMRDFTQMPAQDRLAYFTGLGLVCWLASIPGTALGYLLAGVLPLFLTIALVSLNPLFFLLTFVEVRPPANRLALVVGAFMGPAFYLWSPDYSLLMTGLLGGSLAFGLHRLWSRRRQKGQA